MEGGACNSAKLQGESPHVLLIPYPAQGHIYPMMELGKKLASLGLTTSLATFDSFLTRLASSSSSHHQGELRVPSHDNESFVSVLRIPDAFPPEFERPHYLHARLAAIQSTMEGALVELVRSLSHDGRPVTCLIGDFFLSWMPHLAQVLGLPEVVFWPQNASCFAIYSHVEHLISNGYNPFNDNDRALGPKDAMDLMTCVPGLPPLHPSALPFEVHYGKPILTWLETVVRTRFFNLHQALGVIGNSLDELEPNVCNVLGSKLQNVGPLIAFSAHKGDLGKGDLKSYTKVSSSASLWKEDDCIQWLDKQPPKSVVYVAFGSVANCSIAQIQELAQGLVASNQRFLWVIRKNMVVEEHVNVMEALPKGFWERVNEKGKVITWAPQALVLAHPSVGGFFSHCGWNSCMESLSFGVPMLGWPFFFDQGTNCWLLSNEWKVGLKVKTNHENFFDHLEVERCLRLLMEGEASKDMRARSTALKDVAQQSLSSANSSSHQNLKHLVASINNLPSINNSSNQSIV